MTEPTFEDTVAFLAILAEAAAELDDDEPIGPVL